jgi:hypothetical protein
MNEVAYLALFVSIISLTFNIVDRFARIKVSADIENVVDYAEDGMEYPAGRRIWITITNHSSRRVFINTISGVWSWYPLLQVASTKINFDDIQRYENEKNESIARFWIEPWGNVVLSADVEELEYNLQKVLHKNFRINQWLSRKINYQVVVYDGQQKRFYSNRIKLKIPSYFLPPRTQ